ncbi:hypothetical protein GYH30_044090 [Glycine max]|nr:hypothetical protein GYH30_044090 [Glycine max]
MLPRNLTGLQNGRSGGASGNAPTPPPALEGFEGV